MLLKTAKIEKLITVKHGKVEDISVKNLLTGDQYHLLGEEFIISYRKKERGLFVKNHTFRASDAVCTEAQNTLSFSGKGSDGTAFNVNVCYAEDGGAISKTLTLSSDAEVFLDYIRQDAYQVPTGFSWSRVTPKDRVYVPCFIMTLGQPVYVGSLYTAYKSPVGDNNIENGALWLAYHIGRPLQADFNGTYTAPPVVVGAAVKVGLDACRTAFYDYVYTFSRKPTFYITYNSWYDYMLDINSEIIEKSFQEIHAGFKASGLRDIDCYVVDDGWVDYKKPEFWSFIDKKFPNKFENESKLTKELGSKFGVWFGPRGGYSEAMPYAKIIKGLGYGYCRNSHDICTGHTQYIKDLGDRMMDFMRSYNVEYFKLDGFACAPCSDRNHGHPVGGKSGIYFYTYLWEQWCNVFTQMKQVNPNVFINLTSYAHCSPFFLEYVSAIWMNNASDMSYVGEGNSVDQCLNYRDERYHDLEQVRKLQLPSQFIYNHEPCYGERNYNPPLPSPAHKTVVYTDAEFEKYLYGCMMRGSGFIELYFSPSLMKDGDKYAINKRVLEWTEQNFDTIANSIYIGDSPLKGNIYGYLGTNANKAILYLRNPSKTEKSIDLDLTQYTFLSGEYKVATHYPKAADLGVAKGAFQAKLAPFATAIYVIEYLEK